MDQETTQRKIEHVELALAHNITSSQAASWEDIRLIHQALPEIDRDDIDIGVEFLGRKLRAPIFISSLTGGHEDVALINKRLAQVAEHYGIAMGVGSQRAAIVDDSVAHTYAIVREHAPSAFLIANIGAPQIIPQQHKPSFSLAEIQSAIHMIEADALAIHLNYLQEAAQLEGDRNAWGALAAIHKITGEVSVPVIAKETGAGISKEQSLFLREAGVSAIDVGGTGGSSMAALEAVRSNQYGKQQKRIIGDTFRHWGIPTPISVVESCTAGLPLISTGGVRSGLDAAKALALGATLVGIGFPMLKAASEGEESIHEFLDTFLLELEVAMHLVGASTIESLRTTPVVITGMTYEWLELRGFGDQLHHMAQRKWPCQ
jgi:isopentenyl-diphosphate delta-isomerase